MITTQAAIGFLESWIEKLPSTAQLRLFGITKIPLLFLVGPKVLRLDESGCELRIPLNYITRNHLSSMYFGTMAVGADAVVAVLALHVAKNEKSKKIVPIFKNFKADFHKRAEGPVIFRCDAFPQIKKMVAQAIEKQERVTEMIPVKAYVEGQDQDPVATFELGLSIKAV